jgi:hypothetical protein
MASWRLVTFEAGRADANFADLTVSCDGQTMSATRNEWGIRLSVLPRKVFKPSEASPSGSLARMASCLHIPC